MVKERYSIPDLPQPHTAAYQSSPEFEAAFDRDIECSFEFAEFASDERFWSLEERRYYFRSEKEVDCEEEYVTARIGYVYPNEGYYGLEVIPFGIRVVCWCRA